ncbi:hypothetical protein [Bacillus albus]|uniref:hypothetical protein n=1 Tax=Bacillus cereus group TaxID=86661 RepID=UPI00257054B7|nr:hypothetical protein [Bacillus albus]WJE70762.1 hypothetical protein QRY64_29390 [Bacillus albus]
MTKIEKLFFFFYEKAVPNYFGTAFYILQVFYFERAASTFRYHPAPAARMVGGFASSYEAKSASTSEAPSPSHSERAASAFRHYPVPVASSSHLRTSRTKGKKHLLCERTLAGQS